MSDQPTPPPPPSHDPTPEAAPGGTQGTGTQSTGTQGTGSLGNGTQGTGPGGPPPPPGGGASGGSPDRGPMIVLSYLWLLALIPFLVEKNDPEVKWHAKHGLVLFGAELILMVVLSFLISVPAVGCLMVPVAMLFGLGFMALHVVCIAKALSGQRVIVPYVSEYADRF